MTRLENLSERLAQMRPGTQQARIIVHDQVDRNILDEGFKSAPCLQTRRGNRKL